MKKVVSVVGTILAVLVLAVLAVAVQVVVLVVLVVVRLIVVRAVLVAVLQVVWTITFLVTLMILWHSGQWMRSSEEDLMKRMEIF